MYLHNSDKNNLLNGKTNPHSFVKRKNISNFAIVSKYVRIHILHK